MRSLPSALWGDFMLETLKMLLEITDTSQDSVLNFHLDSAVSAVLSYTRRTELPKALESVVIKLAVAAYNKTGAEGQSAHSEGGISRTYEPELSDSVKTILNRYIKARVM